MRKARASHRRREAPRWTFEEWQVATIELLRRCGWKCEKCNRPLSEMERHHRARRAVGGDRLAVILLLHKACHQWITEHPEESRAKGWIVSSYEPDPATVPVWINHRWWLLDDQGGKTPVESPDV